MNKFGLFLPHWWSKYFPGLYKMMLLQWKNWQSSSFSFRFHDLIQLMINFISINCFLQRVVKDVCTQNWRLPCSSEVVRLNKIWLSSKICIRYSAMEFLRETYDIINLKVEIFKIIYKDFFHMNFYGFMKRGIPFLHIMKSHGWNLQLMGTYRDKKIFWRLIWSHKFVIQTHLRLTQENCQEFEAIKTEF